MATADGTRSSIETASFEGGSTAAVWLLALATYGVGDVVTTVAIVYFVPLATEANPVVRAAIDAFGAGGLLALKALVFYCCILISHNVGLRTRDRLLYYGPPVVLAGTGAAVTAFNLSLIFS